MEFRTVVALLVDIFFAIIWGVDYDFPGRGEGEEAGPKALLCPMTS